MTRQRFFSFITLFFLVSVLLVNCTPVLSQDGETGSNLSVRPTKEPTAVPTPLSSDTADPLTAVLDTPYDLTAFPPQASLTIQFNQPMNPDGTAVSLLINPQDVGGSITWNDEKTSLTFTPEQTFKTGQTYDLSLNPALVSQNNTAFQTTPEWQIQILTPPVITGITPGNPSLESRFPTWEISFDRPMNFDSLLTALTVEPELDLTLTWHNNTLYVQPATSLQPGEQYHFTLAATAVDLYGLSFTNDFTWNATTPALLDHTTRPTASSRFSPIIFRFNYPIDPATATLQISPATKGIESWNEDYTTLTFTPTVPYMGATGYTVQFADGLQDANGDELPRPTTLFFTYPSLISRIQPGENSYVSTFSTVSITFNQAMDPEKTAESFSISPDIAGELSWEGNTMIFTPSAGRLAPTTNYVVSLSPEATDAAGYPIQEQPYTWNFQTNETTQLASFGSGEHTQVMSTNGRRAVQFSFPYDQEPMDTTFALYRLSQEEWLTGDNGSFVNQWTETAQPRTNDYIHVQEALLPADLTPGIYRLDLQVANYTEDSLVIFLSHNGLALRHDGQKLVLWVAGLDGTTTAEAEVMIYQNQQLVWNGRTDSNGLLTLDFPLKDDEFAQIIARVGDDVTYSGLGNSWRSEWAYGSTPTYTAHLYTDRPVYHPSDTLYFRAVIRQDDDAQYSNLPAGTAVIASLHDNNDTNQEQLNLTTSDFGTVNGEFQLPTVVTNGFFRLSVTIADKTFTQDVRVENPPANDLQVTMTTDASFYAVEDQMSVTISARTADGQPAANEPATLTIYESDSGIASNWVDSYRDARHGRTDENGQVTFTLPAETSYYGGTSYWALHAQVGNDTATGENYTVVAVYDQTERVSLDFSSAIKNPGQEFVVTANVVDWVDAPVNGRSLQLTILGYDTTTNEYTIHTQTASLSSDANGRAIYPITISQPGHYLVKVTGWDVKGNEYQASRVVYIYDPAYTGSYGGWGITVDRTQYNVGDTARLIIASATSGPALLTFSRGHLYNQQVVNLTAPLTIVEVPLTAESAPNWTVSIHAWQPQTYTYSEDEYVYYSLRDAYLHSASTQLMVNDPGKQATVTITPSGALTPGGQATFTVRVTNAQGEPISAELSLALVNETIFDLYSVRNVSLATAFYRSRANGASTYHSLVPTRYLGGDNFGGCGCGGYWGEPAQIAAVFDGTVVWFPSLVTDANGEATVTLTLPMTPGEWRLTAKAVTADTQLGETFIVVETQ